jgi:YVTN family beta-propeller protein
MPYNNNTLTYDEVATIKSWIDNGAPNSSGVIMWSGNPSRKKYYVMNQTSDLVTVFDQATRLAMNVITIGDSFPNNAPHAIKVSPDNNYWFVDFYGGNMLEMHSTIDDHLVAKIPMAKLGGAGDWSSFVISPDSKRLYVTDWEGTGIVAYVNLETMIDEVDTSWGSTTSPIFNYPHGCMLDASGNNLYIAAQIGNYFYKLDVNPLDQPTLPTGPFALNPPATWNSNSIIDPHEMIFSPDGTQLYFTCQGTNEVRVMNPINNSLIADIPVGIFPQELSISKKFPYLFISCQEDTVNVNYPFQRGLIAVINYQTNTLIKYIYSGWQPHGIAVDDDEGVVYVANQNYSTNGPAPHHSIIPNQRDGYITIIDMNTLSLVPNYNIEVSSKPYSVAIRH